MARLKPSCLEPDVDDTRVRARGEHGRAPRLLPVHSLRFVLVAGGLGP